MVLTGDCGTSDHDALGWLKGHGIPTIVIDHHQVPEQMPPAAALLNPHQIGCGFPFKGLCSAGVAFYLCAALRSALARESADALPDPRGWLDLVALGTVCDMVPLVAENRILVRHGLQVVGQRRRPGVRALLEYAGVGVDEAIDEGHLGFRLGPRINAPGRLGPAEPSLQPAAGPQRRRGAGDGRARRGLQQPPPRAPGRDRPRGPGAARRRPAQRAPPRHRRRPRALAARHRRHRRGRHRRPLPPTGRGPRVRPGPRRGPRLGAHHGEVDVLAALRANARRCCGASAGTGRRPA
jgi:hypothetical protein